MVSERFFHEVMVVKLRLGLRRGGREGGREWARKKPQGSEASARRYRSGYDCDVGRAGGGVEEGAQTGVSVLRKNYSWRTARMFWFFIWSSMPRGGRTSAPWTMAPRTQMFPGSMVIFSGSKTVWLQGSPIMACLAA